MFGVFVKLDKNVLLKKHLQKIFSSLRRLKCVIYVFFFYLNRTTSMNKNNSFPVKIFFNKKQLHCVSNVNCILNTNVYKIISKYDFLIKNLRHMADRYILFLPRQRNKQKVYEIYHECCDRIRPDSHCAFCDWLGVEHLLRYSIGREIK